MWLVNECGICECLKDKRLRPFISWLFYLRCCCNSPACAQCDRLTDLKCKSPVGEYLYIKKAKNSLSMCSIEQCRTKLQFSIFVETKTERSSNRTKWAIERMNSLHFFSHLKVAHSIYPSHKHSTYEMWMCVCVWKCASILDCCWMNVDDFTINKHFAPHQCYRSSKFMHFQYVRHIL